MKDIPLPDKYCEAIENVHKDYPTPQNKDEKHIWSAGYQIGYLCAMADGELWWRLRQFPKLRAETATRVARRIARDGEMAERYLELCDEMSDLAARKILVGECKISMTRVRQILTDLGLYNPKRKPQ